MNATFVIRQWFTIDVPGETLVEAVQWAQDPKNQNDILNGRRGRNREVLDHNIALIGIDDNDELDRRLG